MDEVVEAIEDGSAPAVDTPVETTEGSAPEVVAATTDPEPEGSAPAEPAQDEPEEFRNLLAKHKGDKAAAARDYWETKTWGSTLRQENEALKAELAQRASEPREPVKAEPQELHPDLKAVEERITAFNEQRESIKAEIQSAAEVFFAKRDEILQAKAIAQYEVSKAEDFEKATVDAKWKQHIASLQNAMDSAKNRHADLNRQFKGSELELQRLNQDKRQAEQIVAAEEARQQQEAERLETFNKEFPTKIDGYITETANKLKVPNDKVAREGLLKLVNHAAVHQYLLMGGVDTEKVNHQALIEKITTDTWQLIDRVARLTLGKASGATTAVPTKPAASPRPNPRPVTPTTQQLSSEDEITNDPRLKAARERLVAMGL